LATEKCNYHQILRRSIDFNPDREAVCTVTKLSQRLDAPPYSQYCHQVHQVSRRCHTATANATAKVRSQESTQHATRNTQEAKSPKAAPSQKARSQHPRNAHSLGFCSRFRAFARASKKAFLCCSELQHKSGGRYSFRLPVGARRLRPLPTREERHR
jgi:hypothetical protein